MPFSSPCELFYSVHEGLGPAGVILIQCSRPPVRVLRSSHDLPSHVLVIASLLVCGDLAFLSNMFIYSVYAFLVSIPLRPIHTRELALAARSRLQHAAGATFPRLHQRFLAKKYVAQQDFCSRVLLPHIKVV